MSAWERIAARIREDANVAGLPIERFRVRAARSAPELIEAFGLLHEAYVGAGLQRSGGGRLRITPQHVLRESVVFVVWDRDQAVGTVTVTGDSPARLPLDKDYGADLLRLRREGGRLVEIGSLAVRRPWRGSGVNLLLAFVSLWAARRILGGSHTVCGVNPSHANYYRALLNFESMGISKAHAELDAPVTGLVRPLATFADFTRRQYPDTLVNGRSLAEEFCGPLPPSCVEVTGGLLRPQPELRNIARNAFQEVFISRSQHLYTLDANTRRYLESQRSDQTLRHAALDEATAAP